MRESRRKKAALSSALTLLAGAVLAGVTVFVLTRAGSAPSGIPQAALAQGYVDRADMCYLTYASESRPVDYDAEHKDELLSLLKLRVGFGRAPDLSPARLRLLGGRISPGLTAPAGFLIYEGENGARVGLYFERADAGPAPRIAPRVESSLTAIEWRGLGMAFVLIGPLGVEAMQGAAELAASELVAPAVSEPQHR